MLDVLNYTYTTPPTTETVIITATRADISPELHAWLMVAITNGAGLVTVCDPVDFDLVRETGEPTTHTFPLLVGEGYLYIENDGLTDIRMNLNGNDLRLSTTAGGSAYTIPEYGIVEYDLTAFLIDGDNSVDIEAAGKPGVGSARIVIHD